MEANIIKIGNSKGIIIPANIIKLLGLEDYVQLEMENEKLIVRLTKKKKPREGWEEAIKEEIEKNGQPEILLPDFFEDEDLSEWTW